MIDFFTNLQNIAIIIGGLISSVVSFFAGRRQRRINNLDKQLDVFGKMIDKFDKFVEKENKNDEKK